MSLRRADVRLRLEFGRAQPNIWIVWRQAAVVVVVLQCDITVKDREMTVPGA
jgi:hypothetical protein